jgi:DNA-binding response OmpR family regulator
MSSKLLLRKDVQLSDEHAKIVRYEQISTRMARILVVEDNHEMAGNILEHLKGERHVADWAETGEAALTLLSSYSFELIILDVMLPDMRGTDVCSRYRSQQGETPILMLTGMTSIDDKEKGLDSGADDYLTKPFDLRELSARIRALLRRPRAVRTDTLKARNIVLDRHAQRVTRDDRTIKLMAKEFALLEFLLRRQDQVTSVEDLLNNVWKADSDSSPDAVRQAIKRLRTKIDVEGEPSIITTVVGLGYTIESD